MSTTTALLHGTPSNAETFPSDPDGRRDAHRTNRRTSVALVTGGGRGIGRIVALALAEAGAAVGLVARSPAELASTVDLVVEAGGTVAAATADVTDAGQLAAAVGGLRERLGPVDLLINNAGALGPIGPLWQTDLDAWWTTIDVNLRGTVLATQLVLPDMVASRHGRIINITSQAGAHRWPLVSAYSVAKAAVIKLTENLAHETARHGVSVFSVHPGLLPIGLTQAVATAMPTTPHEERVQRWGRDELRAGRGADPQQAVDLILRLAAGEADHLSGRHLSVHDDLDALVGRAEEIRERDLYVLRPVSLR
jgi:NAD(P)-dependent dehydrogenase (short-subunit alcohol dehydrogenase family)